MICSLFPLSHFFVATSSSAGILPGLYTTHSNRNKEKIREKSPKLINETRRDDSNETKIHERRDESRCFSWDSLYHASQSCRALIFFSFHTTYDTTVLMDFLRLTFT